MIRERGISRQRRWSIAGLAAAMLVLCPQAALAQTAAPSATGIHIGEGRLHPFIDVDAVYDSLVGFFNRNNGGVLVPSGDLIIHARPGLRFDLMNPSTYISFNGSAEYLFYTGIISSSSRSLSRFQANVNLDTHFNVDGAVEVQLGDSLRRSDQTGNAAVGVGVVSLFNDLRLALPIHPGGRALEVTPRASWQVEFFDPLLTGTVSGCTSASDITCNPNLVSQMNYSNINFGLTGKWKFLPKTALIADVNTDVRTYWSGTTANAPATLFRAQVGIQGLISPRISATLLAGYAGDFALKKLNTVIGNAEVSYTVNEMIKASIGYMRNALPVPAVGTYIDDRGYIKGTLGLWAGRLTFSLTFSGDYLSFYSATPRNDFLLSGNLNGTFAITSWFDVGASYTISYRTSNVTVSTINFLRHEALLHLGFHY